MPTEIIVSLISSVIGGLLVAVVNHVFTRRKVAAEAEKLRAEAEKLRAEAAKMNAEAEGLRIKTITEFYSSLIDNGRWDLLALQLKDRPDDIDTVAERLKQDQESKVKRKLRTMRKLLESGELDASLEEDSEELLRRFAQKAGQ